MVAASSLLLSLPALAQDTIQPEVWYHFEFKGPTSPFQFQVPDPNTMAGVNPASLPIPGQPWIITVGPGQGLYVVDGYSTWDQFELFSNGTSLGVTSPPGTGINCNNDITCALNAPAYSKGAFPLAPGTHTLTGIATTNRIGSAFLMVGPLALPPTLDGAMADGEVGQAYSFTPTLGPVNVAPPLVSFSLAPG